MSTQLCNLADIASILGTPSTLGTPNTFGTHTPKSTVAEPGTPSDMDIASSRDNSPSPLLFHIDLQDNQKKSSPIPVPSSIKLPPLDDIFDYTPSDKPQIACKSTPFINLPRPMEEIWAERVAKEVSTQDGQLDGKKGTSIIAINGTKPYIDDWSLSPHSATWDSPCAVKYMAVEIPPVSPPSPSMPSLVPIKEEEEEIEALRWPTPPGMPPTGDDMHLPQEVFSGTCPEDGWHYNKIGSPKYFRFLIPDPAMPCRQIVTPWIRYNMNLIRPTISGTFGKHHPVINRPLCPTPVDYTCPVLTPEQTAILRQDEPFSEVIDYILQEHLPFNVQAGVQQYRHYDNACQAIANTITSLQEKYSHYLERLVEVLSDLENANILGRILAHHEDFDGNPKAYAAFFLKVSPFRGHVTNSGRDTTVDPYAASLMSFEPLASACKPSSFFAPPCAPRSMLPCYSPRSSRMPSTASTSSTSNKSWSNTYYVKKSKSKRCYRCKRIGHIRQDCPYCRKAQVRFHD